MPKVAYMRPDGTSRTVDATVGRSLMQVALDHGVDGIVAECGGNAMCATCHVYVDPARLDDLGPLCSDEEEMLDCTASPRAATSRLSCQLPVTEDLDGLVLRLPEEQL
ncbi:2Fe-2S iron-sulfur cluster-binding protein [Amycolatopsis sp. NPDC001319]|uniref:2Fe-2S iron-sulfur cluster-binding protein n=1 Tax=unclassified Amycolatopsis TaxID=2618356 RepID=UPI00368581CD